MRPAIGRETLAGYPEVIDRGHLERGQRNVVSDSRRQIFDGRAALGVPIFDRPRAAPGGILKSAALPHVVAKRGALGVFCCASAQTGRGGALKVEDGSFEAMEIAALHLLENVAGPLGEEFDPWRSRPIRDGDGGNVGHWSSALLL